MRKVAKAKLVPVKLQCAKSKCGAEATGLAGHVGRRHRKCLHAGTWSTR